jgi:polysaccharide biosynthesis transport protein
VVRQTRYEGLDVVPCGRGTRVGPELLQSSRMREFLLAARARCDVILVDSAPLGAGVDPFVLGTLTGSMILVVRAGQTNEDMSQAKLEALDRLPIRLLGAVINGISQGTPGYKYYHYYSYLPGYAAEDEEEPKQLQNV